MWVYGFRPLVRIMDAQNLHGPPVRVYMAVYFRSPLPPAEAAVLEGGLAGVAAAAQGLPVPPVPEEPVVSPVRDDVIDHLGRRRDRAMHAIGVGTKRPQLEKRPARLVPAVGAAARVRRSPSTFLGPPMGCAVR